MKDEIDPDFLKTKKTEVEYKWILESIIDGYPELHIIIPVPKEKLEQLFKLEKLLAEFGIVFDSGYGKGCRNWEFDWSLQGKHLMYDKEKRKYKEINRKCEVL